MSVARELEIGTYNTKLKSPVVLDVASGEGRVANGVLKQLFATIDILELNDWKKEIASLLGKSMGDYF